MTHDPRWLLKGARAEDPVKEGSQLASPNYFRMGYQLAAQWMNLHLSGKGADSALAEAHKTAEEFLGEAEKTIVAYRERREGTPRWWRLYPRLERSEERLEKFLLCTVEPSLQLIRAASGEGHEHEVKILRDRAKSGGISYRAIYCLACYEAGAPREDSDRALAYLSEAVRLTPADRLAALLAWVAKDPSMKSVRGLKGYKELIAPYKAPDQKKRKPGKPKKVKKARPKKPGRRAAPG